MNHQHTNWQTQETLFAQNILSNASDDLTQVFKGQTSQIEKRLAIYRNNVVHYATQALCAAYPICQQIVGTDFFHALAREYWKKHPSQHGDLHLYGEQFPEFVKTFEHTQTLPYLSDVASLEWLCHQSYFAKDEISLSHQAWQAALAAPDTTTLTLAASSNTFQSNYPIVDIWHLHQTSEHQENHKQSHQQHFNINWQAQQTALSFRKNYAVMVCQLDSADLCFLNACNHQQSLLTAIESALSQDPTWQIAARLQYFFDNQFFSTQQ